MEGARKDPLAEFLASKRESLPGSAGFEDKVMSAILESERARPVRRDFRAARGRRIRESWWRRAVQGLQLPFPRFHWAAAGLTLLVLGAALTFRTHPLPGEEGPSGRGGTRLKGGRLAFSLLMRREDGGYVEIADGATLRGGERIQGLFWLADSAYVELLSLDQGGKIECYTCAMARPPEAPAAGRTLPFGLELERPAGADLFILAASRERLKAAAHRTRLQSAWKAADGDLRKAAEDLGRDAGAARYRTLLVRRGGGT